MRTTRSGYSYDHPGVMRALAALAFLAESGRELTVREYRQARSRLDDAKIWPDLEEIHRLFGDWEAYIEAGAAEPDSSPSGGRISDDRLLGALQHVAKELGVKSLSSGAYEKYRREHPEQGLPSSSVIRKWKDKWEYALADAGLESVQAPTTSHPQREDVLRALRRAAQSHGAELTPRLYNQYAREHGGGETWPDIDDVLRVFGSWEEAIRQADVEIMDDLQPGMHWTIGEAKKSLRAAQTILGGQLNRERYTWVSEQAARPMPTWDEVCTLLHISLGGQSVDQKARK